MFTRAQLPSAQQQGSLDGLFISGRKIKRKANRDRTQTRRQLGRKEIVRRLDLFIATQSGGFGQLVKAFTRYVPRT